MLQNQEESNLLDNLVQDFESFKKAYYTAENQLQNQFKVVTDMQNGVSRQLQILEKSEVICQADITENTNRFKSIDMNKLHTHMSTLDAKMQQMSQMLANMVIDPEEPNIKLKNNILKRFREIQKEHEKELSKLQHAISTNQKKYDLFKEAISSSKGSHFTIQEHDMQLNQNLNRALNEADSVISMATNVHSSLNHQSRRVQIIQDKVLNYIGSFKEVDGLVQAISSEKHRQQLILAVFILLLICILIYSKL